METESLAIAADKRLAIKTAGGRYLSHLESVMNRKPSTISDYRYILEGHLMPFFGERKLDRLDADLVADYMTSKRRDGLAPKTVANHMRFLHGLFSFSVKRGWMAVNLVAQIDRPPAVGSNPDIRFLELHEIEAVIREVPDGSKFTSTDRAIYLTAAMTGLRQGELIALRWQDVDWQSGRLRVRRNYVRGEWGTPKSKRSSRAVPMVDRVARELERHFGESAYQGDANLVFCHPESGNALDASALRKRYASARKAAGVRAVRFHDLRHTFGTRMAAAGVPMRTLQEWMGHRDVQTTMIYADYAPSAHEREMAEAAFQGPISGPILTEAERTSDTLTPH
jgi:integrase